MRNPIQNIYIKKVEKKQMFGYDKPELWNTVIKTYPNVSQFWTYGKDEIPQAAGLQPRLPALQILRVKIRERNVTHKKPRPRAGVFFFVNVAAHITGTDDAARRNPCKCRCAGHMI